MDSGIWIALIGGGAPFLTPLLVRLFTRDHRKDLDIEIDILNKLKADEDESLKVPAQEFQKRCPKTLKTSCKRNQFENCMQSHSNAILHSYSS